MGTFRDNLARLPALVPEAGREGAIVVAKLEAKEQRALRLFQRVEVSVNALHQYVDSKLTQAGKRYDDCAEHPLSAHRDAQVDGLLRSSAAALTGAARSAEDWRTLEALILRGFEDLDGVFSELEAHFVAHQTTWEESPKFKERLGGYETSTEIVARGAHERLRGLARLECPLRPEALEELRVSPDSTLAEPKARATVSAPKSRMELKAALAKCARVKRRFHDNSDLEEGHRLASAWTKDAEELEALSPAAKRA